MFSNRPAIDSRQDEQKSTNEGINALNIESVDGVPADAYYIRDQIQQKLLAESESEINLDQTEQMH